MSITDESFVGLTMEEAVAKADAIDPTIVTKDQRNRIRLIRERQQRVLQLQKEIYELGVELSDGKSQPKAYKDIMDAGKPFYESVHEGNMVKADFFRRIVVSSGDIAGEMVKRYEELDQMKKQVDQERYAREAMLAEAEAKEGGDEIEDARKKRNNRNNRNKNRNRKLKKKAAKENGIEKDDEADGGEDDARDAEPIVHEIDEDVEMAQGFEED